MLLTFFVFFFFFFFNSFRALCTGEKTDPTTGSRLCYQFTVFHRIVAPEFIVQGGDLGVVGVGDEVLVLEDENLCVPREKGLLCMASSGPNTNKSQFFITVSFLLKRWVEKSILH